MPVKKTEWKKTATKTSTKKTSTAKVAETKKPTVIVETKKTDRCECWDKCNCWESCNCCCKCDLWLKLFILILIIVNLIVSCFSLCSKKTNTSISSRSAWDLEALKVWGYENLEKLERNLYGNESYQQAQKESIEAYISQYWIE